MNGRLYDAKLGRFLAPDNFVQSVFNTQSYNRYGYVLNNPLMYSDPSGEFIITALIVSGVLLSGYIGGKMANGGEANPTKWNWNNSSTYKGVFGGMAIGGVAIGIGIVTGGLATSLLAGIGVNGGLIGGALSGLAGGFFAGGFSGGFMTMLPGGSGDFWQGVKVGAISGVVIGAAVGYLGTPKGFNKFTGNHNPVTAVRGQGVGAQQLNSSVSSEIIPRQAPQRLISNTHVESNVLKPKYVSSYFDDGATVLSRKPYSPQDIIKAVKGDNYNLINNGSNAEIAMTRQEFGNVVKDLSTYGTKQIINPSGQKIQLYDFGTLGTGSIRTYGVNSYRFYWNSQGSNYKFIFNIK